MTKLKYTTKVYNQNKTQSIPLGRHQKEKDFEENLILSFTVTGSTWMHGSKCFIFRIKKWLMSHSWYYHFDTRMPKICLFLSSFLNGGLFCPLSIKFLIMSMDLILMRLFKNWPLVHLIYHQFTKTSHLFWNFFWTLLSHEFPHWNYVITPNSPLINLSLKRNSL